MKASAVKTILKAVVFILLISAAGYAVYYYFNVYRTPEDPNLLLTSGVIEAVEVRVGTKIGGIITELLVEEGDEVSAGDVIARLETTDLRIQLKGAQAAAERAMSLLDDLKRGLRPEEIEKLLKIVELKEANLERARIDYDRKRKLADQKAAPEHEADMARMLMEAARKDLETAQEQVRIARLGSREDQIAAARWALRQAETAVSVTLVDLKRPWVRIFVPENKLGRVRLGMTADILSDSFPDKVYKGIIRHIATEAEFTPKNVQTQEERVKLVYAVKVYVDNPNQELKPGQPVDARIRLDQ